jgi:hypothetical protein
MVARPMANLMMRKRLSALTIEDARSYVQVPLVRELSAVLRKANYMFRILPKRDCGRFDHALALNLTFWSAHEGGDILVDSSIAPDVVAHVAWHHLANRALSPKGTPCAEAFALSEAIASAFDVYLVGMLVRHAPRSEFLQTQIPAMSQNAHAAGLSEAHFERELVRMSEDPERAFEDLRALLFDVTLALGTCKSASEGLAVFDAHRKHRFAWLLHRFELSNWVLYARAYARRSARATRNVKALDARLRSSASSLETLRHSWVLPAM